MTIIFKLICIAFFGKLAIDLLELSIVGDFGAPISGHAILFVSTIFLADAIYIISIVTFFVKNGRKYPFKFLVHNRVYFAISIPAVAILGGVISKYIIHPESIRIYHFFVHATR